MKRIRAFTAEWLDKLLEDAETESGKRCSKWHYSKIDNEVPISRASLIDWIYNEDTERVKGYIISRLWYASLICRVTIGLTSKDTQFFMKRANSVVRINITERERQ